MRRIDKLFVDRVKIVLQTTEPSVLADSRC